MKKYVVTGDIIEVYEYEKTKFGLGYKCQFLPCDLTSNLLENIDFEVDFENQLCKIDNFMRMQQIRRNNVRRLVTMNFNGLYDKFITLTFKENITDFEIANYEFHKFIMRLNKSYMKNSKLKYLAVIEFQDRGAIHYHMICNLPYVNCEELQKCWGNGFIYINAIKHVDNIGAYVVKYMNKDTQDTRLMGHKCYNCSKGLKRPFELSITNIHYNKIENKIINKIKDIKPCYESKYLTDKLGECTYKQYNLNRVD